MENSENKVIHDRLNGLEKRVDGHDKKFERTNEKLNIIDDKHDERYLQQIRITTELQGTSKMTMEATNRMADSIENLVGELKETNTKTDTRFNQITEDVKDVRTKIDNQEEARNLKLEEKKLTNRTLGFIIAGGFAIMQVIIQVIAPLLFGG